MKIRQSSRSNSIIIIIYIYISSEACYENSKCVQYLFIKHIHAMKEEQQLGNKNNLE